MSVKFGMDSNIESVVASIDEVKDDLRHELKKRVGAAMRVMWADARHYVLADPNVSGQLFSAIQRDSDIGVEELDFRVYADLGLASYASIVEFGSGSRTNIPHGSGNSVPGTWPSTGSAVPVGFPYESPDIDYNEESPPQTKGNPEFYGFVKHIEQWMRAKESVEPYTGNYFVSAAFIAASIIERGNFAHPFLRPAWFDNELKIKRAARNAVRNATR